MHNKHTRINPIFHPPVSENKPTRIVGIENCVDLMKFNPIFSNCPSWTTAIKKVFVN